MKNNLMNEIEQIVARRKDGKSYVPMPTYLYVEHYGRNIEENMKDISHLFGEKNFFTFKMNRMQKQETPLRNFQVELDKHAELGKEFIGCVLIEISEEAGTEELADFFEYIAGQESLKCLFAIKEDAEEIQELLEQHFFVRVVEGQKYTTEEQLEILNEVFAEAQFVINVEAMKIFEKFFTEKEWQTGDMVENRIRNIARNLVYEKMMQEESFERGISKEDAEAAVKKLWKEPQKKNVIGFCV